MNFLLRTVGRVLIALAAAAVISGIFWFGMQRTGMLDESGPLARAEVTQPVAVTGAGGTVGARAERMREPRGSAGDQQLEGPSLFGLTEIVKTIVVMAAIVLALPRLQRRSRRITGRGRSRPTPASAP